MRVLFFTVIITVFFSSPQNLSGMETVPSPTPTAMESESDSESDSQSSPKSPDELAAQNLSYANINDFMIAENEEVYPAATFSVEAPDPSPDRSGSRIFFCVILGILSFIAISGCTVLLIRWHQNRNYY